ncbi:MAG: hypothetical protein OXU20_25235 [Myxococcales bacterium]|nr:hypothetical protein [Myxococcales bacterium]MDD9970609.1 hypothetical protein [Myxococcales bacterium]
MTPPTRYHLVLLALCLLPGLAAGRAIATDQGLVKCHISENSKSASGRLVIKAGDRVIAEGACREAGLRVPAGKYTAIVGLDGVLDAPEARRSVTVAPGQTARVSADFATGVLQLVFTQGGKPAAGMAIIRRSGKQIGTVASGVAAHLSVGRYEVTARYRHHRRDLGAVSVTAGGHKTLQVAFD